MIDADDTLRSRRGNEVRESLLACQPWWARVHAAAVATFGYIGVAVVCGTVGIALGVLAVWVMDGWEASP